METLLLGSESAFRLMSAAAAAHRIRVLLVARLQLLWRSWSRAFRCGAFSLSREPGEGVPSRWGRADELSEDGAEQRDRIIHKKAEERRRNFKKKEKKKVLKKVAWCSVSWGWEMRRGGCKKCAWKTESLSRSHQLPQLWDCVRGGRTFNFFIWASLSLSSRSWTSSSSSRCLSIRPLMMLESVASPNQAADPPQVRHLSSTRPEDRLSSFNQSPTGCFYYSISTLNTFSSLFKLD